MRHPKNSLARSGLRCQLTIIDVKNSVTQTGESYHVMVPIAVIQHTVWATTGVIAPPHVSGEIPLDASGQRRIGRSLRGQHVPDIAAAVPVLFENQEG
jgi:hypothetical protein